MAEKLSNTTPLDKLATQITIGWHSLDAANFNLKQATAAHERAIEKRAAANDTERRAGEAAAQAYREVVDLRQRQGAMLAEARRQVKQGWTDWVKTKCPSRSLRDIQRLIKMAEAPDPAAARQDEKKKNREAVQRHRDKERYQATYTPDVSRPPPPAANPSAQIWAEQADKIVSRPNGAATAAEAEPHPAISPETEQPAPAAPPAPPDHPAPVPDKLAAAIAAIEALDNADLIALVNWFNGHQAQDRFMRVMAEMKTEAELVTTQ